MTGKYLRSKTIFSKKVNLMKYQVQTYMLVKTWNSLFVYFPGVSHLTMKSILNEKNKTSNLIPVISSYNICSGNKSQQAQKTAICHLVPKTFVFIRILLLYFINSLSTINFMCALNR